MERWGKRWLHYKGQKTTFIRRVKHKNNVKEVNYTVSDRESRNANESVPIISVPIYWSAV